MSREIKARSRKASPMDIVASGIGVLTASTVLASSGWILYSNLLIDHNLPLPDAIPADRQVFFSEKAGRISFYVDRKSAGRPLVLIHSINAAASAYEMKPVFDYYRTRRPVIAVDLPGYGFSERFPRMYTSELFVEAIIDLLATLTGEPADVVALSLGAEFAARAAQEHPEKFHSLIMISPTGLGKRSRQMVPPTEGAQGSGERAYRMLSLPVWRRALYDLIVTRRSIEFFLGKSFIGPIAPGFVDYAYATSHQPGAEYAPLYFLSGSLFTPDVCARVYEKTTIPGLVIYDHDPFTQFDKLPDLQMNNPLWQSARIKPSMGLPHFERSAETIKTLDGFWSKLEKQEKLARVEEQEKAEKQNKPAKPARRVKRAPAPKPVEEDKPEEPGEQA
jgi:pimeloyl-ACP methyl ester carboxylesterase